MKHRHTKQGRIPGCLINSRMIQGHQIDRRWMHNAIRKWRVARASELSGNELGERRAKRPVGLARETSDDCIVHANERNTAHRRVFVRANGRNIARRKVSERDCRFWLFSISLRAARSGRVGADSARTEHVRSTARRREPFSGRSSLYNLATRFAKLFIHRRATTPRPLHTDVLPRFRIQPRGRRRTVTSQPGGD